MKRASHYLCGFRARAASSAVGAACALVAAGCAPHAATGPSSPTPTGSGPVVIVAVERVYGDLARQLGGADVAVTTVLDSPSADPHAYEPTTHDADAIGAADVVVENGLGYDAFADKLLAASPRDGRTVLVAGALAGRVVGDNPHVWYDVATLRRVAAALAGTIETRKPPHRAAVRTALAKFDAWLDGFARRERAARARSARASVAITEPVFDDVLHAIGVSIATPASFSHAIEEGNDPSPQDVDAMTAILRGRKVRALVYNRQTVEPSTTRLLDVARAAGVPIVPVTETLPAAADLQTWLDGELGATVAALHGPR